MRRRLLAACGAAALSLAVVVPVARAAVPDANHTMEWWTPYDNQGNAQPSTAVDGSPVQDTNQVVTVRLTFPAGVMNWNVTLQPVSGGAPSSCAESYAAKSDGTYPTHIYVTCPWDTTRVITRTLDNQPGNNEDGDQNPTRNWHVSDQGSSVNGKYAVMVTATSAVLKCGLVTCSVDPGKQADYELYQDPGASRWRQVYVKNGIADPTGVQSSFDQGTNRINVTWAPNPEPDVSYLVQEKVGDGSWSSGVTVPGTATNYVRAVDQPGKYQYQVAAVRPTPTADSGNGASATETSKFVAAQAITVAQVSPPTTAAPANGPDGTIDTSDAGGVNLPSDAPTSTAPGSHVAGAPKGSAAAGVHPGGSSGGPRPGSGGAAGTAGAAGGGEAEGEGPDSGFSSTLPYQQGGSADGLGSGDEEPQSMSKLVNVPRPKDARALLVPVAGALAMFVLAAQGMFLLRRRPAGAAAVEDDFDDWMSY